MFCKELKKSKPNNNILKIILKKKFEPAYVWVYVEGLKKKI